MNRINGLDLDLLKVLAAVLEHRSTTKAGAALGVTQSAVSHALKKLRLAFDDNLLIRAGNKLVLTQRAAQLQPRVGHVLAQVETLLEQPGVFSPKSAFPPRSQSTPMASSCSYRESSRRSSVRPPIASFE